MLLLVGSSFCCPVNGRIQHFIAGTTEIERHELPQLRARFWGVQKCCFILLSSFVRELFWDVVVRHPMTSFWHWRVVFCKKLRGATGSFGELRGASGSPGSRDCGEVPQTSEESS